MTKIIYSPDPIRVENSLRRQTLLAVTVALLVIVALVLASFFLYIFIIEQEYWRSRQTESASSVAKVVTDFLERTQDFINTINVLEQDDEHFAEVFTEIFPLNPTLEEMVIVEDGVVQYAASKNAPILANSVTLQQSNWYIRTLEKGQYVSNIQATDTGDLYVILAQRASVGEDVIAARLLMSVLNDELETIRFGESGDAYVIDFEGRVIAHADDKEEGYPESIAGRLEFATFINAPNNQSHGEYINAQGEAVLGTSLNIPGTSWILVSEIETDEAFATSRNTSLSLSGAVLVIGGGFLLLSRQYLTSRFFSPLTNLRQGALRVEAGDLQTPVPVTRRDEIGQLTETFNIMMYSLERQAGELRAQTVALQEEVNERKRTEVELEQAVADLIVANEKAEEISRLKSEFLATMSHELRTPMSAIIGFSGIMLEGVAGSVDDEGREMVEGIYHSGQHLLGLINNMLDLAKIEAGRLEIHPVPLSLSNLVEEMRERFTLLAKQKNLQFNIQLDPALPPEIVADRTRLAQIMTNLLGNAIKFTDKGQVDLLLSRKDDRLVIEVRDTGIGIPPHALDYIFDEFRQVDGTSRRVYGGTGLGLAIVRKLSAAMGGQVTLQSTLEQGSTFTVTVPYDEVKIGAKAV